MNALLFAAAGTSLRSLSIFNLALLMVLTLALHYVLRQIADRLTTMLAVITFLTLGAFGDFTKLSNYNFITPYAHSATYGFAFCVFAIASASAFAKSRARLTRGANVWIALTGACAGWTVLTKPELFLAGASTSIAALLITLIGRRETLRRWLSSSLIFFASFIAAPAVVLALIAAFRTPWPALLRGTLAPFLLALDPRVREMEFYQDGLGLDFVTRNAAKLITFFCVYLQLLLPPTILAIVLRRRGGRARFVLAAVIGIALGLFVWRWPIDPKLWADVLRGVPLLALLIAALLFIPIHREMRYNGRLSARTIGRATFTMFSIAMLARMPLNARIYQYGFIQATPAVLLCTMAAICWLPEWLRSRNFYAPFARLAGIGVVAGFVVHQLETTRLVLSERTLALHTRNSPDAFRISPGHDELRNSDHGELLNAAIDELLSRAAPTDTLAALPEAAMLNFITRMPNPTRYEQLSPFGLLSIDDGERGALAEFQSHPPTFILIMHQPMNAYGPTFFGRDYAVELGQWINDNYDVVNQLGDEPNIDMRYYGIRLLRKRGTERVR